MLYRDTHAYILRQVLPCNSALLPDRGLAINGAGGGSETGTTTVHIPAPSPLFYTDDYLPNGTHSNAMKTVLDPGTAHLKRKEKTVLASGQSLSRALCVETDCPVLQQ